MTKELSEAEAVQVAAFGLDKPEPNSESGVFNRFWDDGVNEAARSPR